MSETDYQGDGGGFDPGYGGDAGGREDGGYDEELDSAVEAVVDERLGPALAYVEELERGRLEWEGEPVRWGRGGQRTVVCGNPTVP